MSEQKVLKDLLKEKELDVKTIKSECAEALMAKEKTLQTKLLQLENTVSDLEFKN